MRSAYSADLKGPLHLAAFRILRQGAVNREVTGLIGPEFEGHGLPGPGPLGNAVRTIDGEAVGQVLRGEGDLHEVVSIDGDRGGGKGVMVPGDGEFADLAALVLSRYGNK